MTVRIAPQFRAVLVFVAVLTGVLLAAGASLPLAADAPPALLHLKAGSFDPLAGALPLPPGRRLPAQPSAGEAYFLVQTLRPLDSAIAARLDGLGVVRVGFVPDNGFAVRMDAALVETVRALPFVRWVAGFEPGWKISPDIGVRPFDDPSRRQEPFYRLTLDLWPGEDPQRVAGLAAAAGADILKIEPGPYPLRLRVTGTPAALDALAAIPAVQWIEEIGEITPRNTTTPWVIQSNLQDQYPVWNHGLHGEGQIIGHIDGRIDIDSCYFRDPVNNTPGPSHRKVIAYRSNAGLGRDSHGTHTAGTAAGDRGPVDGSSFANGNAWAAKLSHSNLNDITGSGSAPSNLYTYLNAAHTDGARTHTNSWGDDGTTAYTTWCRDIDQFMWDREDSLVLFAVTNLSLLKTPENAKNSVGVGASGHSPNQENFCSGGRGPTNDGRRKPEVFTPGCSIISARSFSACDTTTMTGTSMASPSTTAAATLIRQYYTEGWYPSGTKQPADAITPSGALLKATLVNGTVNMTGITGYPSDQEGWGRELLDRALFFDGDVRKLSVIADRRNVDGFTTGQDQTWMLQVGSSAEPLRVTLAWTEPPASLFANPATVNDIDLVVTDPSGTVYRGNVFDTTAGTSLPGGVRDAKNNLEQVHIAAPAPGTWQVQVVATAVNQGAQGFALVASGDVITTLGPALRHEDHQIQDAPPFGNGDGILDPGETAVVPVTLRNSGTADASGVSARATAGPAGLVHVTRAVAAFPNIAKGATGASLPPHFEISASPALMCGTSMSTGLAWTTAGPETGSTTFTIPVGKSEGAWSATDVPITLPKRTLTGVSSTQPVSDSFTIADATVAVNLLHGDLGEVILRLTSPAGTTVTLHNKSRAGQADISTTYDTLTQPDGPGSMNDVNGQNASGTWRLTVIDDTSGSTAAGRLMSWTLQLKATGPFRCSPLICADPVPGAVGSTLLILRSGASDLRFDWDGLPGVSNYRIWESAFADFSVEDALAKVTGVTEWVQTGGFSGSGLHVYRVRALNSCNQEGP